MNTIRVWLNNPLSLRSRIALWVVSMVLLYVGLLFARWCAPYLASAIAAGLK